MALSKLDSTALGTLSGNLAFASGQGIDFSATGDGSASMSNELMDDYERGTWTPIDTSGAGLTFTITSAEYVKIGDLVSFQLYITYPVTSNASTVGIGGLPYTVGTGYYYMSGRVQGQSANDLTAQIQQSATTIALYYNNGGLSNSTLSGDYVIMSGTYIAA